MRPSLSALALGLAFAILMVAVAAPARADAGKPSWSTGDFWAYSYTGSVFPGIGGPGSYRLDAIGIDTVSVGSASYESFRLRLTINGSNVVQYHGGDAWFRTSDLSLVKQTYNVTATIIFDLTFIVTITYDPPLAVRWPLVPQSSWNASSTLRVSSPFSLPPIALDTSYVVEATSTVTVSAGTFETTPLRAASGERSTTYWAPTAGNYARRQTFNSNNQETSSAELTSFRYAPGFLGLPLIFWFLVILLVVIVTIVLLIRRRRPQGARMPSTFPPP